MAMLSVLQEHNEDASARVVIAKRLQEVIDRAVKRVLVINPPQISEADFLIERALNSRYWNYPPYGPGVLCRNLELRGFETELLDLNFEVLRLAHELREQFKYQMWREKLRQVLDEFHPDLVSVSCMFSMTHVIMKEISEVIKEYDPKLPVAAGGVHVSNATKLVLQDCPNIDFAGLYEGDRSFPDLLDFINGKQEQCDLTQVAMLINGKFSEVRERAQPDEEQIQVSPLYHKLPIERYDALGQVGTYGFMRKDRPAASLLRERGCRAHCSFCSVAAFNGRGVRERNYLNVADELQELVECYGIKHITFLDDDLLSNPRDLMRFFHEIVRRRLAITWDASNGLIAAFITPELMDAMVASGCVGFNLGIESGSPKILREVHKPGTVESFRKCKTIIDKYPQVFVKGFLMIGFPGETLSMMLDTVKLGLELSLDWYAIQILNPLPSTEIYGIMIEQGMIQDGLETSNVAFVFGPHGRQRLMEERQRLNAADFLDLFRTCSMDSIPAKETLGDYWFMIDYKLNYEKLLGVSHRMKLAKIRMMLADVCHRIASDNPMAWLFLGLVDQKLGQPKMARTAIPIARKIVRGSAYWQKRFETLELYDLLDRLDRETA